eukprot:6175440-Pleurochrysis_carterae.AAC.3
MRPSQAHQLWHTAHSVRPHFHEEQMTRDQCVGLGQRSCHLPWKPDLRRRAALALHRAPINGTVPRSQDWPMAFDASTVTVHARDDLQR